MKKEKPHGEYVRKVQEETQRYSQDLLAENGRLRVRVAGLEAEVARLQDLEGRLEAAEEEQQRSSAGYREIERQNANLANLYVASYRLHGTLDRGEVLLAIQEIVINLIGCEEMAIFELEEGDFALRLAASFGLDEARYRRVPLGSGAIGRAAASGLPFLASEDAGARSADEADLTACVPVMLDGRVIGAIALFRLLSHKSELADIDREIFDLLATQAGSALYCSRLRAERLSR